MNQGLDYLRNISIQNFTSIDDFNKWKKEFPLYFIYNIQFTNNSIFVIYRVINESK